MSEHRPNENSKNTGSSGLNHGLSRRKLLQLSGALASAAVAAPILAACGDNTATTAPAATSASSPAAGATSAATSKAASSSGGTLVVYWNPGHAYDIYKQVIAKFEQDHPGWKVQWEKYQWPDMRTKVLANFAVGTVPDLIEEPGGWVPEFALQDKILSLQPYIESDGKSMGFPDDWQTYTVKRNTINGQVYGIQLHSTCTLLFYNKDLFSKAKISNPPTNWNEFLDAAKATTQGSSVFGFAPNQDYGYTWPWLLQNQVKYYNPDTKKLGFDNEDAYAAMQFQADLIHKYKVAPIPVSSADYEGPQKLFSANRTAMIITGPWDLLPIQKGSPNLNWAIAPALTGKIQATNAAGTSLFIPKGAKNPDLSWDLIKRFTALEVELAATKEANMTMPRKSWAANPDVQANQLIAPFAKGLGYAVDSAADIALTGNKYSQIDPLFQQMYQSVIYKNVPAKDALQQLETAGNKILAS
ncbi:MAG TPA: sugar ABC transporter substrate-binding protein [Chloroflexia bacterium]|nr:sugar ABC transporter substrate-binding protein [Chloroflexia bacterium]